jgi:biopolymer transport protein ExbD
MAEETEKLSAAQRSRVRRLSTPKELSPDEEGGELNIVPFLDIITNVLMFVLATISVTFTTIIETQPPGLGGGGPRGPQKPTLSLNIVVVDQGFLVSAFGQRIGEGCQGTGSGVAVGMKPNAAGQPDYDYAALGACAKRLKNQVPDAASETNATLIGNHDTPYRVIISTMDAIRKSDDGQELFPDVNFGVPK